MNLRRFTEFFNILLDGFTDARGVCGRVCVECLLEGGNRKGCSTATTKETSHFKVESSIDLEIAIFAC
jgi:hypothetical protein